MGNPRCSWVRDRLPLLAGEELLGSDRRRVERHLIGCPGCRHHRDALANALEVLHAASAQTPSGADAPSLWPELARQIRESHRPVPAPGFALGWPRLGLGPALGLGLGLLALVGVAVVARNRGAGPPVRVAALQTPIAPAIPKGTPPPAAETPEPAPEAPQAASDPTVAETVPASRLGYDLDHGMPMGTEPREREGKQPTY